MAKKHLAVKSHICLFSKKNKSKITAIYKCSEVEFGSSLPSHSFSNQLARHNAYIIDLFKKKKVCKQWLLLKEEAMSSSKSKSKMEKW